MKLALIGYGKMGHIIEAIALERGHEITERVDVNQPALGGSIGSAAFREADVAIEFTTPQTAVDNYRACFECHKPVVSGTTGWLKHLEEVRRQVLDEKQTMFYSSNFSLGVNIFMELNRRLAELMRPFGEYQPSLTETHHIHKLDAPSGTALTLAVDLVEHLSDRERLDGWCLGGVQWPGGEHANVVEQRQEHKLPVTAIREGEVPGTHTIAWSSEADAIEITHRANSRRGFALGVVMAAEFTANHHGWLTMKDMLGF